MDEFLEALVELENRIVSYWIRRIANSEKTDVNAHSIMESPPSSWTTDVELHCGRNCRCRPASREILEVNEFHLGEELSTSVFAKDFHCRDHGKIENRMVTWCRANGRRQAHVNLGTALGR